MDAYDRRPTDPPAAGQLRLATLNLWGWFADWPTRLNALSRLLPDLHLDVLLLQETCCRDGIDQAWQLQQATGLPYLAIARLRGLVGEAEGVAVLSRHPILFSRAEPLPRSEPARGMLLCCLGTPHGRLWVNSAHTAFAPQQVCEEQVQLLAGLEGEPMVLGGDLNATPDVIYPITEQAGFADALPAALVTWPTDQQLFRRAWQQGTGRQVSFSLLPRRLDYLLLRGCEPTQAGWVVPHHDGVMASDHVLLWADVDLRQAGQKTPESNPEG